MNAQKPNLADFFTKEVSDSYDKRNSPLHPISDGLHFLVGLVMKTLPRNARILCVGVGTGAEILALATEHPAWSFVGVDPSASMLDVCRDRLATAGLLERCDLLHGYVQDVPVGEGFDAVLSLLVAHFIAREDRPSFYAEILKRVTPGGYLISAEISFDLESPEFPAMLENWMQVQSLMGATPESLKALPHMLRETLCVLSPAETEAALCASGFTLPIRFFQAFMISGWYARRGGIQGESPKAG